MTMNADLGTQAGQSWCAGAAAKVMTSQAAVMPSWLAPRLAARIGSSHAAAAMDLGAIAPHDMPFEMTAMSSPAVASLRPPPTPVISSIPDAPLVTTPEYPDLREENAELRKMIESLTVELGRVRRDIVEATEPELVRLACAVAERIVGAELSTDPGHILGWAREGIDALDATGGVVLAVAPDLKNVIPQTDRAQLGENVTVEVDASLPAGTCEARSKTGAVKIGAATRMAEMASELGVQAGQGQGR